MNIQDGHGREYGKRRRAGLPRATRLSALTKEAVRIQSVNEREWILCCAILGGGLRWKNRARVGVGCCLCIVYLLVLATWTGYGMEAQGRGSSTDGFIRACIESPSCSIRGSGGGLSGYRTQTSNVNTSDKAWGSHKAVKRRRPGAVSWSIGLCTYRMLSWALQAGDESETTARRSALVYGVRTCPVGLSCGKMPQANGSTRFLQVSATLTLAARLDYLAEV